MIHFHVETDPGKWRQENQDSHKADSGKGVYIISDGMGGLAGGKTASKIVAEVLFELLSREFSGISNLDDSQCLEIMKSQIISLSDNMKKKAMGTFCQGMGATVVAAIERQPYALIGHVGDSRAYLYRDEYLLRLTQDHSFDQLMGDENGEGGSKSMLLQHLGMKQKISPGVQLVELLDGDFLLLCTDGVTHMLDDESIRKIISRSSWPGRIPADLIEAANNAGGRDNSTVMVLWN